MQFHRVTAILLFALATGAALGQGGEVLNALSARPHQAPAAGVAKAGVRTQFIYQNQPQVLPVIDDFSVDRTRKRWATADDANVTLDQTVYKLEVGGVSTPGMVFSSDTTFRFIVDTTDPDTVIITREALPEISLTVRNLNVFPPTEEVVTAWPPYTVFDTLTAPPPDTLYLIAPQFVQDSLLVYTVAPDPRTYAMGATTVPFILWEDDDVYVNDTYPVAPPTIGVATFDGLARNGLPYDFANYGSYGIADKLTSVPIDLLRPASDSVYLSFYYQARGLSGDAFPQPQDSLLLEFYAPQEDTWYRVWRSSYPNTSQVLPFRQVNIPIREFRYLQDGFRMRFSNYATLSGSFDHWHLDYVRLAAQRRFDDTTLVDVAYIQPASSLLETFTAVPFNKFEQSPASYMAQSVTLQQRNLDDQDRFITYGMRVELEDGGGTQNFSNGTNTSGNAASVFSVTNPVNSAPNNFLFNPSLSTDAAFWKVKFWTNATPDINRYNDTTTFIQELSNFYAYDDGSAEMGYGLNSAGGKLAYRFDLVGGDSLRAIRMYFNPIANAPPAAQPPTGSFLITVWRSLDPEVILHQNFSFSSPEYRDHGLNKFVEYPLDSALWVEGTIFIGWTQTNTTNMNLGFDRNRNNSNKIFFKTGGSWQPTQQQGSLMMRPVFVAALDPFTGVEELAPQAGALLLYPNPANDLLRIRFDEDVTPGATVECLDALGRSVMRAPFTGQEPISVSGLADGLYTLRLLDRSGTLLGTGRLAIQR